MLRITSTHRRDFLRIGALASGFSLAQLLRAGQDRTVSATLSFGRAKHCILLFLTGGPPQHDTWDPKPSAPERIRGELRPIVSRVPGVHVSELFPLVAQHTEKLCIVRSVTHHDRTHTSAGYTMLTGMPHPLANTPTAANIRPTPNDHPHLGALLSKVREVQRGIPVFASLPESIKDANVNPFPGLDGGMMGNQYAPLYVEADRQRTGFLPPDILLPPNITPSRLDDRRVLLDQIERRLQTRDVAPASDMDGWYQRAFEVMRTPRVRDAFDLSREPWPLRRRYGDHLFGQGCLLARRLIEAGVGLVSVYWHYEGPDDSPVWDTHENNYPHLRQRLMPPTDAAFSALLADLSERGLLDETLVICMGEFGRTPQINRLGGRDHWSAAQSIALAGAGIAKGTIYGSTDRDGGLPADQPVSPADLFATFMHLLGIPRDFELRDRSARPVIVCQGHVLTGLLS